MTTTLLPPSYPTGVGPAYDSIQELLDALWDRSMDLESQFIKDNDEYALKQFRMNFMVIQYWEEIYSLILQDSGY